MQDLKRGLHSRGNVRRKLFPSNDVTQMADYANGHACTLESLEESGKDSKHDPLGPQ